MFDGVLNVYKEKGYTSHDVVAKLRGILGQKKIGHTGTLDPDAQGVLPVCLGKATRLCDMLTDHAKTYEAVLLLGKETDTQDISGQIIAEKEPDVSEEEVCVTIMGFVGEYAQIPPMYSARKVNGKKLYELARAGKVVERQPRQVTIYEIAIKSAALPRVTMIVRCSKGTYIRTLCHDIGQKLGCGGCMESLLRTQVGRFGLEDSLRLSQIQELCGQGLLEERILSIEEMFEQYPKAVTVMEADNLVHNGNPLRLQDVIPEGHRPDMGRTCLEESAREVYFRVCDSQGNFMGIYKWEQGRSRLKPWKMFLGG
ncbi:MAG: tRNA pseudouridine(55) synthase TruB [Hungatella sp.]|nr:tRNA pseudouridine(55) synthase TruB [Hungatella sp.]